MSAAAAAVQVRPEAELRGAADKITNTPGHELLRQLDPDDVIVLVSAALRADAVIAAASPGRYSDEAFCLLVARKINGMPA